jgi:hypothetical protein
MRGISLFDHYRVRHPLHIVDPGGRYMFRVHAGPIDYAMLAIYFVVVLGIGFIARRQVHTGLDFFLSGRSLPAWITGLAFIAANLGA